MTDEPKEPAFVAGPLAFGKKLAHTDKAVRDKGLRILTDFLRKKGGVLTRTDYLKLWKALVYCFWMSDQRLVQQELAVKLAMLGRCLPRDKYAEWIGCFWESLTREWQDFDRYRMNKYLKLVRIQTAEMFHVLREHSYDSATANAVMKEMRAPGGPLHIDSASGVALVLANFWWQEFQVELDVAAPPVPVMLALLEPWVQVLADTAQEHVRVRVAELLEAVPAQFAKELAAKAMGVGAQPQLKQPNRAALYALVDSLNEKGVAARLAKKQEDAATAPASVPRRKRTINTQEEPDSIESHPTSPRMDVAKAKKRKTDSAENANATSSRGEVAPKATPKVKKAKENSTTASEHADRKVQCAGKGNESPQKAPLSPSRTPPKEVWPGKSPPKSPPFTPSEHSTPKRRRSVGSRSSSRRVSFSTSPPSTCVFNKKRAVAPPGSPLPTPSPQKLKSCLKASTKK